MPFILAVSASRLLTWIRAGGVRSSCVRGETANAEGHFCAGDFMGRFHPVQGLAVPRYANDCNADPSIEINTNYHIHGSIRLIGSLFISHLKQTHFLLKTNKPITSGFFKGVRVLSHGWMYWVHLSVSSMDTYLLTPADIPSDLILETQIGICSPSVWQQGWCKDFCLGAFWCTPSFLLLSPPTPPPYDIHLNCECGIRDGQRLRALHKGWSETVGVAQG